MRNLSYWVTEICLHSTFPPDNDSKAGGISLAGVQTAQHDALGQKAEPFALFLPGTFIGTDGGEDVFQDEKCWYFKNIYANAEKNYYSRRVEPEGG